MKCFHHTDLDGRGSAYWVNEIAKIQGKDCEFIPINYNKQPNIGSVKKNEEIYIVDFSFEPDDMKLLVNKTDNVVWIDHHVTAIKKLDKYKNLHGLRDATFSGTMLTYFYYVKLKCMKHGVKPTYDPKNAPVFTQLINDHDLWKFEFGNKTKSFQIWMDTYAIDFNDPDSAWRTGKVSSGTKGIIAHGSTLLNYKLHTDFNSAIRSAFPIEFEGVKFLAINRGGNSSVLESIFDPAENEAMMLFQMGTDKRFKVSLYGCEEHDIDLSKIAAKHGGGGHKKACGFYVDNISEIIKGSSSKNPILDKV